MQHRVIGYGAHSDVFMEEGSPYVIKRALPHSIQQLHKENAVYLLLQGTDGILNRYSYRELGGTAYLTLERAGGSLLHMIDIAEEEPSSFNALDLAFTVATLVLSIISSIHKQGIVHSDIHLANILFSNSGMKLIDFGSSRFLGNSPNASFNHPDTYGYSPYYSGMHCIASGLSTPQDDIVSFAYTLVYIAHGGQMSWDDSFADLMDSEPSPQLIVPQLIALKKGFSPSRLCQGLPKIFESFLTSALNNKKAHWKNFPYNYWRERFNIKHRISGSPPHLHVTPT
ncbi:kinase-like protein [Pleurotus eryngii]|uniref:Kinase-like protein n=1 Tax=Pleurotus eryngii TaxID=5323 RepID=A0A9P6D165_PLEER|nr:kinase-like protein [Pleurotus eryngii]